jgi:hypothetical protein
MPKPSKDLDLIRELRRIERIPLSLASTAARSPV